MRFTVHVFEAIYNNERHSAVVAVTALCASKEPILRRTKDEGRETEEVQIVCLVGLALLRKTSVRTGFTPVRLALDTYLQIVSPAFCCCSESEFCRDGAEPTTGRHGL